LFRVDVKLGLSSLREHILVQYIAGGSRQDVGKIWIQKGIGNRRAETTGRKQYSLYPIQNNI